jgi:hypothetical protein
MSKKRDSENRRDYFKTCLGGAITIIAAVLTLTGTLVVGYWQFVYKPSLSQTPAGMDQGEVNLPTLEPGSSSSQWTPRPGVLPIHPEEATPYLESAFTMWTIEGYLGDYPQVLSAFHSLLLLNGENDPVGLMQIWIEEAKQMAADAIEGTSPSDYEALEFNLSSNYESLELEECYFILWEHALHDPVPEVKASNMAAIRLALIASIGEDYQQELIGIWNEILGGQ